MKNWVDGLMKEGGGGMRGGREEGEGHWRRLDIAVNQPGLSESTSFHLVFFSFQKCAGICVDLSKFFLG